MPDDSPPATTKDVNTGEPAVHRRATVDFALVVGVDHYPNFRKLEGAVKDATEFYAWVCSEHGGAVAPDNAHLILSAENPIAPIQDQIDEKLLELMKLANALGGGRRLYFYFSGHGATDIREPAENVALLLARWSRDLARVALSSRDYSDRLKRAGLFEELAVFLDCCRSVGVGAVGMPPTVTFDKKGVWYPTRNFIAYATEPRTSAYETHEGDQWQGVFTRRLLTLLRKEPAGLPASLLKTRLELVEEGVQGQQAEVHNGLLDDARFGRRGELPHLHISFRPGRTRVRLRDGGRRVIDEHDATAGPWELALGYGLYLLEDDTGSKTMIDHGHGEVTRVEF